MIVKERKPSLAFILSLLNTGLGHIYTGHPLKGLMLIFLQYASIIMAGTLGALSTFYGIIAIIIICISLYIYSIIDSTRLASRANEYTLKAYNRWYLYVLVIFFSTIAGNTLISARGTVLGYETYRIPAKSMDPTLKVGDCITVDTRDKIPSVGDIVVFKGPENPKIPFVKRVAALSNDTISIRDGSVIVNGKTADSFSVPEVNRMQDYSTSMGEVKVQDGHIFLLGDFRDNSKDSRFVGAISKNSIIGKVKYIWFSPDFSRIGKKVE